MIKSNVKICLWGVFSIFSVLASYATTLNGSLEFNGSDQYIEIPAALIPATGNFTVEVWVKSATNLTGYREILSQSGGTDGTNFYIGKSANGTVRIGDHWATVDNVAFPDDGQWHHFAVVNTVDGTTLYQDGEVAAQRETPIGNPAGDVFRIGRQYGDFSEYFAGNIDELRIWNTGRSVDQIQGNLYNELIGTETGLVAYYKMGLESDSLADSGPNGYNGAQHNSVLWGTSGFPTITFSGIGSQNSPFEIGTLNDLQLLSQTPDLWHKQYQQTENIEAAQTSTWNEGTGFSPIGNSENYFTGVYDGGGHVISNLSITRNAHWQAFFGITDRATIKRLGIEAATINSAGEEDAGFAATLAGRIKSSTVEECFGTGSVHGNSHSGGLIGHSDGASIVRNSYSRADVVVDFYDVGGLIGPIDGPGQVINSYSAGLVTFPVGAANIGGLVGRGGTVVNSFWDTEVSGITTSSRGTGRTTSEMKQLASYNGWIFSDMWHIDESATAPTNGGYPSLAWQGQTHNHTGVPNSPVITSIASVGYNSATVVWGAIPTATQGYVLDVSKKNDFTSFVASYEGKVVPDGSISDLENLEQNSTYFVRVRSVNAQGESPNSPTLSFKTLDTRYSVGVINNIVFDQSLIPDTGDFTIEYWINMPKQGSFISQGQFSISSTWNLKFPIQSNQDVFQFRVAQGQKWVESKNLGMIVDWRHFAIVKRGKTILLYENGFLKGFENPDSLELSPSKENTVLGGDFLGADELRIWNYAKTSQNISSSMFPGEIRGNETGLVAYVDFNERSGNTVTCKKTGAIGTATGADLSWEVDDKTRMLPASGKGFAVWQHSHRPQNIAPHQASVVPVSEKDLANRNHSLLQVWIDQVKTTAPAMVNGAYNFKDSTRWARGPEWLVPEDTSGVMPKYYALNSEALADANNTGHTVTDVFFQYEAGGYEEQTISTTFKIDVAQQDSLILLSHYTHRIVSPEDGWDKRAFAFIWEPTMGEVSLVERAHSANGAIFWITDHGVIDTVPKGTWKTLMYEQGQNGITYFNIKTGEGKYYPLNHTLNYNNESRTYDHFVSFVGKKGDRTATSPWDFKYGAPKSYRRIGKILSSDVALFHGISPYELNQKGLTSWHEDTHPQGVDTVRIPTVVHAILYDPPGDASVATLEQGASIQSGLSWSMTNEIGVSAHIGGEGGNEETGNKADVFVEGGLTFKQEHSDTWSTTVVNTQGMSSMTDENDARYIGPGKGDMFFISPVTLEYKGYKKLKLNYYHKMDDSAAYTYFLASRMLALPTDALMSRSISGLKSEYKDHPEFLELLQKESAVDIYTGKIKQELIDNGRLIRREAFDFSGNSGVTRSTDNSVSWTGENYFEVGVNVHIQAHFVLSYVKFGGDFNYSFSTGWQDTKTIDSTHKTGYVFLDNESWDKFQVTTYLDQKFGTLVYDVDTVFSYSSWPYEEGYSRKSTDFIIQPQDTLKAGFTNQDLTYNIWVKNTTPTSLADAPQELTYTAETVNFSIDATVHPSERVIAIGDSALFTVTLSSSESGEFDGLLRIGMQHPSDGGAEYDDLELLADVVEPNMELSALCENSNYLIRPYTDPKEHQFQIVLTNLSEVGAVIETGVLQSSAGVNTQLGSFSNPVGAGGSRNLFVNLTYTSTASYPKSAVVWVKLAGNDSSYQEIRLSVSEDDAPVLVETNKRYHSTEAPGIYVYNNPASLSFGKTEFRINAPAASQVKVEIYNVLGGLVHKDALVTDPSGSATLKVWDLTDLSGRQIPTGTYLIRAIVYNKNTSEVYRYRAKIGVAR